MTQKEKIFVYIEDNRWVISYEDGYSIRLGTEFQQSKQGVWRYLQNGCCGSNSKERFAVTFDKSCDVLGSSSVIPINKAVEWLKGNIHQDELFISHRIVSLDEFINEFSNAMLKEE